MLKNFSALLTAALLVTAVPGCNYDFDIELPDPLFTIDLSTTGLGEVPNRMALGSSTLVTVMTRSGTGSGSVTSSDDEVLAIERVDENYAELHARGLGTATVSIWDGAGSEAYSITVAQHERFEVLLVERTLVPEYTISIAPAHLNAMVSHRSLQFVIAYYDAEGLLYGSNLASFERPAGSEECASAWLGPFDTACLVLENGAQFLKVEVGDTEKEIAMVGVPEEDIIDLYADYRPKVADAQPGETIQVIAAGLTTQGTRVYGVPSVFETGNTPPSVLVYEYDPEMQAREVELTAFAISKAVSYEGEIQLPPNLDPGPYLWRSCGGLLQADCQP
jgi:hypothetical protein